MQEKLQENTAIPNKDVLCAAEWGGRDLCSAYGVCEYEGVAGTHNISDVCLHKLRLQQ